MPCLPPSLPAPPTTAHAPTVTATAPSAHHTHVRDPRLRDAVGVRGRVLRRHGDDEAGAGRALTREAGCVVRGGHTGVAFGLQVRQILLALGWAGPL